MANLIALKTKIDQGKGELARLVPEQRQLERLLRVFYNQLKMEAKLANCSEESLLQCLQQVTEVNLEPGSAMGLAYLIPYGNKCTLIIGYKGLIELARRSGDIKSIGAHVVYENDDFEFEYGLEEKLKHKPSTGERGAPKYVYSVAKFKDGGYQFEVMSMSDVDKIMENTPGRGNSGPWKTHKDEMMRKTAVRRLFKYLPSSIIPPAAHEVIHIEDEVENGNFRLADIIEPDEKPKKAAIKLSAPKVEEQDSNGKEHSADSTSIEEVAELVTEFSDMATEFNEDTMEQVTSYKGRHGKKTLGEALKALETLGKRKGKGHVKKTVQEWIERAEQVELV